MVERTRGITIGGRIDRIACVRASVLAMAVLFLLTCCPTVSAAQPGGKSRQTSRQRAAGQNQGSRGLIDLKSVFGGKSDKRAAGELLAEVPRERLTPEAKQKIDSVTQKPTLYRRLPTRTIDCDPDLFLFLTRKPETIVGIWDVMGITKVQTERVGPYQFDAVDGSGTSCRIDLLYGDRKLHVFHADGMYDGKYTQKPVTGRGVFVLKSEYATNEDGSTRVIGTLDCYVKFDSLGADLLARTLGGLIGKSADHNFTETSKFIEQVSTACHTNPTSMLELADRLPQVQPAVKMEFAKLITTAAIRHLDREPRAAKLVQEKGISPTPR